MDGFRSSGFVGEDSLEFMPVETGLLRIEGEVSCLGGIVIRVAKALIVTESESATDPLVQTVEYGYNAFVRGEGSFLRHDNFHAYPGHHDAHHRHELDWKTGKELPGSPMWVGPDGWPTLSRFMEEVESWYWKNKNDLPNPDGYGEIDVRG